MSVASLQSQTRNYDEFIGAASIPGPSKFHRHASPSGPWPWNDIGDADIPVNPMLSPYSRITPSDKPWHGYPGCLFPNWKDRMLRKCGIQGAIDRQSSQNCMIYTTNVMENGKFHPGRTWTINNTPSSPQGFWDHIQSTRRAKIHVRTLWVSNMHGCVLQMLGKTYNIEPFFFSSSLNWIPCRYQEIEKDKKGDHITIILRFLRSVPAAPNLTIDPTRKLAPTVDFLDAPLFLPSMNIVLRPDLLALHMIRSPDGSTIISYHPVPPPERNSTSASLLNSRFLLAGDSVYWSHIFREANDPTFALLPILWHPLYSWDEALENLYGHICYLEAIVIQTHDMTLSTELHIIRAHLLHHETLLVDFENAVEFILETESPGMGHTSEERATAARLMSRECKNLLSEIKRLKTLRALLDHRLANVMNQSYTSVNIEDSKLMQSLTKSTLKDSAAMKVVSYLSAIYLPASFASGIFGMNVDIINPGTNGTLMHYFLTAVPLTLITIWLIGVLQTREQLENVPSLQGKPWKKLMWLLVWPVLHFMTWNESHPGADRVAQQEAEMDDLPKTPAPGYYAPYV